MQIRQYWDQASLLRKLNVIGSRNNWPISDTVDQKRIISSSIAAAAKCSKKAEPEPEPKKSEEPASKEAANEPETPLSFFEAQSVEEPLPATKSRTSTFSAKPAPRDYNDLFQGDDEPLVTPPRSRDQNLGTPKTVSKNYTHFEFGEGKLPGDQPVRPSKKPSHFEFGDEVEPHVLEEQKKLTERSQSKHPGHFEFGEAEECPMPVRPRSSKHLSQWDFEDFVTPEKPKRRLVRGQEVRHFGWSDDEVEPVTPKPKPRIAHPRRDAETHFKLQDEQTPPPAEKAAAGAAHNRGLKLYEHNLYDEDEKREEPLTTSNGANKSNSNNGTHRRKIFDPQWEMKDEFVNENGKMAEEEEKKPVSRSRMGVVKLMDSSWDKFDENTPQEQPVVDRPIRANPARQSVYSRNWGFGDED